MTTHSTARHELPGPSTQSNPERDGSAWTARLQRARDVLRGAVRGAWPEAEPVAASTPTPMAVVTATTDHPAPPDIKRHREEDRTTRVYQRPAIESALIPIVVRGELPRDEVSTTSRLPSADLEALLLQLQYDAGSPAASMSAPQDPASATEVEVSSITFEELNAFRQSLVDRPGESDEEILSTTPETLAPPPALSREPATGTLRRRLRSVKDLTLRWAGAMRARSALLLRPLTVALASTIVRLRMGKKQPVLPVLAATASSTEAKDDASASK